jgi:SAM domain (Sterile alpha motif)
MSEIRKWLEAICLDQYADAFEANKIDMDLLGQVDDQILKDIGVSAAGDRLRIRNAIAKVSIPQQSWGLYVVSRSKRLAGALTRPRIRWAT